MLRMGRPGEKITRKTIMMQNKMKELDLKERSSKSLLANVLDMDDDFRPSSTLPHAHIHPHHPSHTHPLPTGATPTPLNAGMGGGFMRVTSGLPAPPSEDTRQQLVEALRPDVAALAELMETETPPWDLESLAQPQHD